MNPTFDDVIQFLRGRMIVVMDALDAQALKGQPSTQATREFETAAAEYKTTLVTRSVQLDILSRMERQDTKTTATTPRKRKR